MMPSPSIRIAALTLLTAATLANAAEDTPTSRGQWVCLSPGFLETLATQDVVPHIKIKPADEAPGAGICGIFADRQSGQTYYVVQGRGIFLRNAEGKPSFTRVDGEHYDAYYENAGPDVDPEGRGICVFSIQGWDIATTSCISHDSGKTWASLTTDPASIGFDLGAVDWAGGGKTILAKRHHNGDLELSRDSGATWQIIAPKQGEIRCLGLLGANVLLKGINGENAGLYRSSDAGASWTKVADCSFANLSQAVVYHDKAYVACAQGVLVTSDQGEHWKLLASDCPNLRGPVMIGRDDKQLVVFGAKGFYESLDAGETWKLVAPFSDDPALRKGRYEYGSWNPADDTFYVTHIAGQAYSYRR